jgi:hypothetical protein
MTTRQKISILKKALKLADQAINAKEYGWGICNAIWEVTADEELNPAQFGIKLPPKNYEDFFCWPLTKRGAAIRRRVLQNAIKRLEK